MAVNPDIYKPRQGTNPKLGSLRFVRRGDKLILQQYQASNAHFRNNWYDVGIVDEATGLAEDGQDVG